MRVLLITPYFPPQSAVASLRVHAFAQAWADAGEQVTVLTASKRADQAGLNLPRQGFEVVEIPFAVPSALEHLRSREKQSIQASMNGGGPESSQPTLLQRWKERSGVFSSVRMPDLTDWWIGPALQWCRTQPPWDCLVSSSGPYTAHLVAMRLMRERRAQRWIADFRDLWTRNHLHRGLFPFTLRERLLERQCLRSADVITTVSEGLAHSLRRRTHRPIEVIYNGFDPHDAAELPEESIFPRDGLVRIVYTGTLYPRGQSPDALLRAFKSLQRDLPDRAAKLRLTIAGRGEAHWRSAAQHIGVTSMLEFRGLVSRADALRMQRDADALLLLDWNDPSVGVLTTKVFEYLNAAAPIIIIGSRPESELIRLVNRAWRGFEPGIDQSTIIANLRRLLSAEPRDSGMQPDRDFIATLTRSAQSARMLDLMRSLKPAST